jgi:hypothetical protein
MRLILLCVVFIAGCQGMSEAGQVFQAFGDGLRGNPPSREVITTCHPAVGGAVHCTSR